MKKQDIVTEYIKKYPKLASLALARTIYQDHKAMFANVEAVRTLVRYYRGLTGEKNLKQLKDKSMVVPKNSLNAYNLPRSRTVKRQRYVLPAKDNNILFISDLHIPYHDIKAVTCALDYGKKMKVNTIFINGDLIDFYPISRFTNVRKKSSFTEEITKTKQFLDVLRSEFPDASIYLLYGNHDNRLEHFLATKAPELLGTPEFRLDKLLDFDKYKIKHFEDTTLIKIGKLTVTHGHLLIKGIFAPVNPARGVFLRAKAHCIISHVHNPSTHTEKTIKDEIITTYSTGCLCELNPDYNPFGNNFSHGFAHITVSEGGKFRVDNKRILDGVIF